MSVATPARPARTRRRGRESATDMIRSLGLVLLIVVPVWFLAQPPGSDEKAIRVVDPAADVAAFANAAPGVPVPGGLPAGWRATSATLDPAGLRIGWVTPAGDYAEYAASARTGTGPAVVAGAQVGAFLIEGVAWRQYRDGDEHTSLVRDVAGGTVVVGGVRETSALEELRVLAAAVR